MQGSTITDLAKASALDRERVKKILEDSDTKPIMITGGKRKIEYFDHEKTLKLLEAWKAEQEAIKTPVAQAASTAIADSGKVVDEVVKKVTSIFTPKFQSLTEELRERDKALLHLVDKMYEATKAGSEEAAAHTKALREYVSTATAKLGVVENATNKASASHVEKLHALRTDVEGRLSALTDSVNTMVRQNAKSHDDFTIRLQVLEEVFSETSNTVQGIYAMLQGLGVTNPLIPTQANKPAAPPPAAATTEEPEGPTPLLGVVGFLDRQASEIRKRLKGRAELRVISSQTSNPSVDSLVKCDKVWVCAAFVTHSVQEKLTRARVDFEIIPTGSQSGFLRTIEEWLTKRKSASV